MYLIENRKMGYNFGMNIIFFKIFRCYFLIRKRKKKCLNDVN